MGFILFSGISLFPCFINMTLPRLRFGGCGCTWFATRVATGLKGGERGWRERERERTTMICTMISGYISRGLPVEFTPDQQ